MDDLKDRLTRLADEGTPRGAHTVLFDAEAVVQHDQAPLRRIRRRWVLVVAVAAVVALVGAVAVVAGSGGSDRTSGSVAVGPPPPFAFVPSSLPAGIALLDARGGDGAPLTAGCDVIGADVLTGGHGGATQVWGRYDSTHTRLLEEIRVTWTAVPGTVLPHSDCDRAPRVAASSAGLLAQVQRQPGATTVEVRNHAGVWDGGRLAWNEADGRFVDVLWMPFDAAAHPGESVADADLRIATSLTDRRDRGFDLSRPPSGFELVGEFADRAHSPGRNLRTVEYGDGNGHALRIEIVDRAEVPPMLSFIDDLSARLVRVRGRIAVQTPALLHHADSFDPSTSDSLFAHADQFLHWDEPDGLTVTVLGVGLTPQQLQATADSLHPLDQRQWQQLVGSAHQEPGSTTPLSLPTSPS